MSKAEHIELHHGAWRASVSPDRGAVLKLVWYGADVLRPAPEHPESPFEFACFPMVPYVNRIAAGRFSFGGQSVRLKPNARGQQHPLHGQGWLATWDVVQSTASSVRLSFGGGGDEWPWPYRAEQSIRLLEDSVEFELSARNFADTAAPLSLGFHPYFPQRERAHLQAHTTSVWHTDEAALPTRLEAVPRDWSFDRSRSVAAVPLDHCFGGWDGHAQLQWPGLRVLMEAQRCPWLHVYAPPNGSAFCVEPTTAAPCALNRDGEVPAIATGAWIDIRVRLTVRQG